MNNEYIRYAKLVLRNKSFLGLIFLVFIKIFKRIISIKDRYNRSYYPDYLKNLNINEIQNNRVDSKAHTYTFIDQPKYIKLASHFLKVEKDINWMNKFQDPEDYESLHRWGWFLWIMSESKLRLNDVSWCLFQIENWVDNFHNLNNRNKINLQSLEWESYTISERVCNIIIASEVLNINISQKITNSIVDQVKIIITRLEFFGNNNTGNHIINNARAIYLAGAYFKLNHLKETSYTILQNELKKIITNEGFLREGSSHYQFIVTRWLLEIYVFSKKINDSKMQIFLDKYFHNIFKACNFFLIKNNNTYDIPYFGDISPDNDPKWVIEILKTTLITNKNNKLNYNSWNNIFGSINYNFKTDILNKEFDRTLLYYKSGWFRIQSNNHKIFTRSNSYEPINYPNHEHNDQGHIVYYYKNVIILNDSGRINYSNDNYKKSIFHNCITINDVAISPNFERFKKIYKYNNKVIHKLSKDNSFFYYSTNSFKRINIKKYVRFISLLKNEIIINDKIINTQKNKHIIRRYFHFPTNIEIIKKNKNYFIIDKKLYGKIILDYENTKVEIINGKNREFANYSNKYGEKISSKTMVLKNKINKTSKLIFAIKWIDK